MKFVRIIPLIFLLADACIEPVKLPVLFDVDVVVVDGLITDQPGPHVVKLHYNFPVDDESQNFRPIAGATVRIVDDHGNIELLQQTRNGVYSTSAAFRGIVGRSYQLRFETQEGRSYESSVTPLSAPGVLEDLYFEFRENSINENDISLPQDAFFVFMDAKGSPGATNLFRWRWKGTYYIQTFPQFNVLREGINSTPDPLPCSGYIVRSGGTIKVGPCECCDCWVSDLGKDVTISDRRNITNPEFNRVLMAKIPFDTRRFTDRYHIQVDQLSVSEDVHDFWRLVAIQKRSASDIFQPNAIKIRGNISSSSDPEEKVFGVFSASAITTRTLFIERSDVPKGVPVPPMVTVDCRLFRSNSSNVKPPFW